MGFVEQKLGKLKASGISNALIFGLVLAGGTLIVLLFIKSKITKTAA